MLNEENQIGVVLFSSVKPEQVSAVMTKVMTEMGQEFPHQDVTVAVYQVATPPKRIGTAHLDGQAEKATYTSQVDVSLCETVRGTVAPRVRHRRERRETR